MPTIHVEKSDTAEDIARKIRATDPPKVSAESALAAGYAANASAHANLSRERCSDAEIPG